MKDRLSAIMPRPEPVIGLRAKEAWELMLADILRREERRKGRYKSVKHQRSPKERRFKL